MRLQVRDIEVQNKNKLTKVVLLFSGKSFAGSEIKENWQKP